MYLDNINSHCECFQLYNSNYIYRGPYYTLKIKRAVQNYDYLFFLIVQAYSLSRGCLVRNARGSHFCILNARCAVLLCYFHTYVRVTLLNVYKLYILYYIHTLL